MVNGSLAQMWAKTPEHQRASFRGGGGGGDGGGGRSRPRPISAILALATQMPRLVQHVNIPRPPEEVFAFLTDFARVRSVIPGMVEARVLTPGPVRKGSRVLERREAQGRVRESELLVTVHEPPRRFWTDVLGRGKKAGESGFLLERTSQGHTRLAYTVEFRLPGLTKLLAPWMKPSVRNVMAVDLQAIHDHLTQRAR